MKLKTLALGLALALAAVSPADAQRGEGGGGRGNWELLGEQRVGFGADRDVINLGFNEEYFRGRSYRRLRFVAEGGEVRMRSVRLHYLNGHVEDFQFEQNLRAGQEIDIDLRGERSYLRQIEMFYKAKFGVNLGPGGVRIAQPSIKVLGENVRGGPVAPPVGRPAGGFDEIARERFDRRDPRVEIRVGRREGRFGQIRLKNTSGDRIDIQDIVAEFGNGERQRERLTQRLEPGELSRPIDLAGDQRFLKSVIVNLEPRRRPGSAELALLATERPGRGDGDRPGPGPGYRPAPSWQLLGQQSIGFGVDRDVIRVGQSEDWYRNRGFDRLHFVAENNEVHMISIRVVYLNGHAEDYRVDRLIRTGGDLAVDLPGRRSYIREIEMVYRGRSGFGGRSVVSVYGESAPRR